MDAFVKRCEQCKEPVPETKRGRPQRLCSDRCRQAHRKINATAEGGLKYRTGRLKPKRASQDSELSRQSKPENPSQKTHLRFERVNEVTCKLTDGENTNVPASHGQWGGYRTTKAVALRHQYRVWPVVGAMSRRGVRTLILQRGKDECSRNGEGRLWRLLHRESNRPPQRTASSPARPQRGGGVMSHRNLLALKNLDVPQTSHDPVTQAAKGSAGDSTLEPLLSVVCLSRHSPIGNESIAVVTGADLDLHVDSARFDPFESDRRDPREHRENPRPSPITLAKGPRLGKNNQRTFVNLSRPRGTGLERSCSRSKRETVARLA